MSALNRRSILAGAAAVPALAIPAAGAAPTPAANPEPDPVFAAVAAHREAFVKYMRTANLQIGLPVPTRRRPRPGLCLLSD